MLSDQKKTDSIFFKRNSCRHFTPFVLLKDHIRNGRTEQHVRIPVWINPFTCF